jgi:hypothetical protein
MPLFGKRQVQAQVTALAWSRVIQLEQQEWVAKRSSWVPSDDVRNVENHSETYWATVTDTQPGPPDANGMPGPPTIQTRQELRSRFYYTFEQLEWHKGRAFRATGTDPSDVHWPQYTPEARERVRDKKETYTATFASTESDKQYEVTLPEQEWRVLERGGGYRLTLGLFGGVKKVAPAVG